MPETSSRNWDAFNLEELDRRHKEARKKKLYDKFNKSKKDKRIVQPKKSPAGLFICPQCNVPLNANKLESHLEKVHGFKFKTPSNKGHKIKSASESTKTGVK